MARSRSVVPHPGGARCGRVAWRGVARSSAGGQVGIWLAAFGTSKRLGHGGWASRRTNISDYFDRPAADEPFGQSSPREAVHLGAVGGRTGT